jgi:hypothetical protein
MVVPGNGEVANLELCIGQRRLGQVSVAEFTAVRVAAFLDGVTQRKHIINAVHEPVKRIHSHRTA